MKTQNKNSPIIPFLKGDYNKSWFTLVELIVVITILAILSTIWFVSYSSYLAWSRDTNRISQLKAISEWLKLYSTNHSLPTPDTTSTKIMDGLTQIATQWYAWKNVLETITYSTEWVDPKDKTYFSYYLTQNKKYFQLMAFLEEEENLQNQALWVDYSKRYPTVFWDKLWILTTLDNEPIQLSTGSIDISWVLTLELKSYLKDNEYITWSWLDFINFVKVLDLWWRGYSIDMNNNRFNCWINLDDICDMWTPYWCEWYDDNLIDYIFIPWCIDWIDIVSPWENKIVYDKNLNLYWESDWNSQGRLTWDNAVNYCNNLELWWYLNWRLPSANELSNIRPINKSFFELFVDYDLEKYWTSNDCNFDGKWSYIMTDSSVMGCYTLSSTLSVFCVHE